jgi:cobalt/nickel transport system ATP-binding protein
VTDHPVVPADGSGEPRAAVRLRHVTYSYPGGHRALDDVSFDIAPGERVAVLGPNGAGKTTLVLHLNGVLTPRAGAIEVGDLAVVKANLREIRRRVGIVFQDPDDQLFMPTVREDVAFGPANLGLRGDELDERVQEALDAVGMRDVADRSPHHLSFGQRRRVAAATVLAMRPDVLVLDEPSSNLDPAARREFAEIVARLDLTTVMVTHDLPYAMQICERALVLNEGRVVADGPIAEVLADAEVMAANRLELPFGFDPIAAAHVAGPRTRTADAMRERATGEAPDADSRRRGGERSA